MPLVAQDHRVPFRSAARRTLVVAVVLVVMRVAVPVLVSRRQSPP